MSKSQLHAIAGEQSSPLAVNSQGLEFAYSVESERALLGAILINNRAWEEVGDFLKGSHFSDPFHRRIFEICARLLERGDRVTPITLATHLDPQEEGKSKKEISRYLLAITKDAILPTPPRLYAEKIHDLAIRRELLSLAQNTAAEIGKPPDPEKNAVALIEELEQQLFALSAVGEIAGGPLHLKRALEVTLPNIEAARSGSRPIRGITSGFTDLDSMLGGLHPSDLLILAARPSMGKTALAINISRNAAEAALEEAEATAAKPKGVVIFSQEMSAEQLVTRLISNITGIGSHLIRRGLISKDEYARIVEAGRQMQRMPIYIDDSPALSVSGLRARARRLKRRHDIGLVVVDYLQLLTSGTKVENRTLEISHITRILKSVAMELQVPVLALSQLSRRTEERDDKIPQLFDLRDSGSIEQDADVVMFIHREAYYLERKKPPAPTAGDEQAERKFAGWQDRYERVKNQARLMIAKHRSGPTGNINLYFNADEASFRDLAPDPPIV